MADGVNALRAPDRAMLVITHYQRLLDHIVPDRVHVLAKGRIVRSGGAELALELEAAATSASWRPHDGVGASSQASSRTYPRGLRRPAASLPGAGLLMARRAARRGDEGV